MINKEVEKFPVELTKVPLNSGWLFTKEETNLDGEGTGFEDVTLPHTWNAEDGNTGGSDYYRGTCTYKKLVHIDEAYEGRHIYLEFGAANSEAKIYVNGKLVDRHIGGYSLFRVNVTDAIQYGKDNLIMLKVDNSHIEEVYPLMADFTFFGGLYREAQLIIVNDVHIDLEDHGSQGVYVSQKEVSRESATIGIETKIVNKGMEKASVEVQYRLLDQEGNEVASTSLASVVTCSTSFIQDLTVKSPTLWHGTLNPYLYQLITTVNMNGVEIDRRENRIGLRYYEVHPQKGFFLNGESMKLNGVSRHQDRAVKGWALSKEDQKEDIKIIKEIGANSIRLAHYQHNPYFYELCDIYGMVVWAEIPLISKNSKTDMTGENAKSQMIELIRQNYNYASILFWGVQNETTIGGKKNGLERIVKELHELTKKEDHYRLTTQAQVGHHPDEDSMNGITDVLAYNKYYGWYYDTCEEFETWLTKFNKVNPGLSLGISEYGCEGILDYHSAEPKVRDYTEEYQAIYHEKVLQIFNRHDEIWGTYVWNMFDFASDLRDEGGVKGMNNKGLVTHDRKTRKDAFYYYKATWSKEPVLHITSKRFEERLTSHISVKVYSNQDEVTLIHNGVEVGSISGDEHVFTFENIALNKGDNEFVAKSGTLLDSALFKYVETLTADYDCPVQESSSLGNWFDNSLELDENIEPLEFPEGYFTVEDSIEEILDNPEGEAVLRKFIAPMFDHAMFEMAKSFSLKMIQDFDKSAMNDILLYNISKELNKIKK